MATAKERFDERVSRFQARDPVRDIPLNDPTPEVIAPGTQAHNPAGDVPFSTEKFEQASSDAAIRQADFDEKLIGERAASLNEESAKRLRDLVVNDDGTMNPADRARRIAILRQYRTDNPRQPTTPPADPRIDISPLPTGMERIDKAGQRVRRVSPSGNIPSFEVDIPPIEDLPFDHPLRVRKQRADEGVDMISGVNFGARANIARSPEIERLRAGAIKRTMGSLFEQVPDDLPKLRYDTTLGEFQVLTPQEDGLFRWTSMDGTGLEWGDIGDMFNPAEIASLALSIVGTGKVTKAVEFGVTNLARTKVAAGGLAGGLTGRVAGDAISIVTNGIESGEWPTWEELRARGWEDAQVELFASVVGEVGGAILRKTGDVIQDAAATLSGKQGIKRTDLSAVDRTSVEEINENIAEAKSDLQRMQSVTGREDLAITRGQAWRSVDVLSDEAHARSNASAATRQAFRDADAAEKQITDLYIQKVYGDGVKEALENRYGTIVAANEVLDSAGTMTVLKSDKGELIFLPKSLADNGPVENLVGLKVVPKDDGWHIAGAGLPDHLLNTGVGKSMYISAAQEAKRHGHVLVSDSQVSGSAKRMWESLAKGGEIGEIVPSEAALNQTLKDGQGRTWFETADGSPAFRVKQDASVSSLLLRKEIDPITGRAPSQNEMRRFLRRPGRNEMAEVVEDMANNPYIRQDFREAILKDWDNIVGKGDKLNKEAMQEWQEQVGQNLENFFSPREMVTIRSGPSGLRQVVEASRDATNAHRNALSSVLKVPNTSPILRDNKRIWTQMKNMDSKARNRVMRVLDAGGQGDPMRALFRADLENDLLIKANAKNWKGFRKWLTDNRELINDMLGSPTGRGEAAALQRSATTRYIKDLEMIGRVLRRRTDAGMVRGTATEANPTSLALFRVTFGPLSRAQRFLTGARRGVVRWGAANASDLITDPGKLRQLVEIQQFPLASRAAARVYHGALDMPAFFGMENFNPDDEADREEFAQRVNMILQGELSENVEQ